MLIVLRLIHEPQGPHMTFSSDLDPFKMDNDDFEHFVFINHGVVFAILRIIF